MVEETSGVQIPVMTYTIANKNTAHTEEWLQLTEMMKICLPDGVTENGTHLENSMTFIHTDYN